MMMTGRDNNDREGLMGRDNDDRLPPPPQQHPHPLP